MDNELISDAQVQKALDYLRDNAERAGYCKGQRYQLEEGRKVIKARLMKKYPDLAVNAQEREAYADASYEEYLVGVAEGIAKDEECRWHMKAAEAKIECWRTYNANLRSMKI